jgi:hypothetical protein
MTFDGHGGMIVFGQTQFSDNIAASASCPGNRVHLDPLA